MRVLNRLYDLCHPLLRAVRGNRSLIRRLFGVSVPRGMLVQFDPTTVSINTTLRSIAGPGDQSCLEVGIGQGALLSLALALRQPMRVTGVDCSEDRVKQSREVARANGIEADFFVSDLLSAIPADRRFDLIFFNPPYVPSEVGERLRLTQRFSADGRQAWDGGPDGTGVLRPFLDQAKQRLTERGRIVFGVQWIFVPDEKIQQVVNECGLTIEKRHVQRFVPSVAYVVRPISGSSPRQG